MPQTIQEIREKTELFFHETLKLADINKRNGTVNCGYCFMRLDDYIRDGVVHGEIKPVATQSANIFTYPQYESQAESPLKILSSFTKDKRLLQRCAPLTNKTYNLSLKNGETVEIIDLTIEGTPAPLDQLTLQRVDTLQGQDLITNLKNLPRRAKDGTAYGCILLTWPDKEAHLLNFFVTSKADCSEVFFVDAQARTISNSISTDALPDIYFLQSMPPEGFEITLKKEPVEINEQEQAQVQAELTASHDAHKPMANPVVSGDDFASPFMCSPISTTDSNNVDYMLNLFKSHYSHLNATQFYKIWRDRHQGKRGYHWVLSKLKNAGFIKENSSVGQNPNDADDMLNLFKSQYSHLSVSQFYEIWCDEYHGAYSHWWVQNKLQEAGLLSKKSLKRQQPPSTINSSCPPSTTVKRGTHKGEVPQTTTGSPSAPLPSTTVDNNPNINRMLDLFKSQYSHLKVLQFYKIWRDRHQGTHSYHWVLNNLQNAGLVTKKSFIKRQPSATIESHTKKIRII